MNYRLDDMPESLLLHPLTKKKLESALESVPQVVLLHGEPATGKKIIARWLAASILGTVPDNLRQGVDIFILKRQDDKKLIGIEEVRTLTNNLHLSTAGKNTIRRIILIEDFELLSTEAQNKLLKTLEEPPSDSVFILTTSHINDILPTVRSRTFNFEILPVPFSQAEEYFSGKHTSSEIRSAWSLSGGASGLLISLLDTAKEHELKVAVQTAKNILRLNTYQKLQYVDALTGSPDDIELLLLALTKVLSAAHKNAVSGGSRSAAQIIEKRKLLADSFNMFKSGANPKLLLSNLMLSL